MEALHVFESFKVGISPNLNVLKPKNVVLKNWPVYMCMCGICRESWFGNEKRQNYISFCIIPGDKYISF